MDGQVTCNEEKCQQSLDAVQISTSTTTFAPRIVDAVRPSNIDALDESGEKGLTGNMGPPGLIIKISIVFAL